MIDGGLNLQGTGILVLGPPTPNPSSFYRLVDNGELHGHVGDNNESIDINEWKGKLALRTTEPADLLVALEVMQPTKWQGSRGDLQIIHID